MNINKAIKYFDGLVSKCDLDDYWFRFDIDFSDGNGIIKELEHDDPDRSISNAYEALDYLIDKEAHYRLIEFLNCDELNESIESGVKNIEITTE